MSETENKKFSRTINVDLDKSIPADTEKIVNFDLSKLPENQDVNVNVSLDAQALLSQKQKLEAQLKYKEAEARAQLAAANNEKYKLQGRLEAENQTLYTEKEALAEEIAELKKRISTAKGAVGLQNTAGGQPLDHVKRGQGYESYNDMYLDLKAKELAGDPDAKQILNALTLKLVQSLAEGHSLGVQGKLEVFGKGKPLADIKNEMFRKQLKLRGGV
jgi:hypothetical protein